MVLPAEMLDLYILAVFGAVLLVFLALKSYTYLRDSRRAKLLFIVGQVWNYRTRKSESSSYLTIVKIEKYGVDVIFHINVEGIKIKPPNEADGYIIAISHLPLTRNALESSVTSLARTVDVLPDYEVGYNEWKKMDVKPVYDIPIKAIIDGMEAVIRAGADSGIKTSSDEDE